MSKWMIFLLAVALTGALSTLPAQTADSAAGHWEGSLQLPNREVNLVLDLAKNDKQSWIGHLSFVGGGPQEVPLEDLRIGSDTVAFRLGGGLPDPPLFEGKLDPGQKTITGTATQGGNPVEFKLKRTGEAKVVVPVASAPVSKDLEGNWEGTLEAGQPLRLVLKLKNDAQGHASGSLVSLDQGATDLPLSSIVQDGSKLTYVVKLVGGKYSGSLNEAKTELTGEWSQGGRSLPLKMTRQKAPSAK